MDVLEHEQTGQDLQKEYAQKEQLLSAISSILICVDDNGRITQWNTTAEKTFGIKKSDVIGRSFRECGVKWEWDRVSEGISACRRKNQPIRIDDIQFTRSDGNEGLLGMTLNPINGKDDEYSGFLLLSADITERKILEEQLRQAQKLESIGRLAAGIAHEINTPVQYVRDNIHFLQESFTDISNLLNKYNLFLKAAKEDSVSPELVDELENALDEVDIDFLSEEIPLAIKQSLEGINRVVDIVEAMREFAHPGIKEKTPTDINKLVVNTITIARNEWKYVAEVKTDFDLDLPLVECLPGELSQVILNILLNAVHAITEVVEERPEDKGVITISTHRDDKWVEIRVSDTGTGIPKKIRPRVFERFFTTKEVGKGTGQGLAIAYNVVVGKHNGTITFETKMGKGTTFIIRLPIESESA